MNEVVKKQLVEQFGEQVRFDEPLSKHSTYKIGGNAHIMVLPETDEALIDVFRYVKEHNLEYFILGGGSNVLLPDEGFHGIVIKPKNNQLTIHEQTVSAGAGAILAKVASETAKAGLIGFEWGIAVPGTVGGAVRGNAGAFGGEIKDHLVSATIFDGKEVKDVTNKELDFSYRTSRVKHSNGDEIVINATFRLDEGSSEDAQKKVKELLTTKFAQQPMGEPCAGCLFKNIELIPGEEQLAPASSGEPTERFFHDVKESGLGFIKKGKVPAGWLIDQLGLKGYEKDGIKVSEKHANFLVNTGEGDAAAVHAMVKFLKDEVYKAYGVHLEEEVQLF